MRLRSKQDLDLVRRDYILGIYDAIQQEYIYPTLKGLAAKYDINFNTIRIKCAEEHWEEARSLVKMKMDSKKSKDAIVELIYTASNHDRDTITQIEKIRAIIDAYLNEFDYIWNANKTIKSAAVTNYDSESDFNFNKDKNKLEFDTNDLDDEDAHPLDINTINEIVDSAFGHDKKDDLNISFDPRAKPKKVDRRYKKNKELYDEYGDYDENYSKRNNSKNNGKNKEYKTYEVETSYDEPERKPINIKDIKLAIDCLKGLNEIQETIFGRNEQILDLQAEITKLAEEQRIAKDKSNKVNVKQLKQVAEDKLKELDKLEAYRTSAKRTKEIIE